MEEKLDLIINQLGKVQHSIEKLELKQDRFEEKLDHVGNSVEKLAINHANMLNKQEETNTKLDNFAIETRSHFKHMQSQLDTHTNIIKKALIRTD